MTDQIATEGECNVDEYEEIGERCSKRWGNHRAAS